MASLSKLADKLKQQKIEATKIRRKNERLLKEAKSLTRRSSSGLHTLERKLEDTREKMGDINVEFNQILARKESIERLIKAAHERLKVETDAKEQAEIDMDNADSEDAKHLAADRLAQANEKIQELKFEIKQREAAAQKLIDVIEDQKKSKSRTSVQIHKQAHAKPTLVTLIKKGRTSTGRLQKRLESSTRREDMITRNLEKVTKKLEEMKAKHLAKKRKEAAIKAAKKRAAKKRALALARKKAAKKRALALKRKAALKKRAALKRKKAKPKKKPAKKAKKSKKKSRR
ncbi:MAG: ATPase V [Candidatus Nitrosotenuis sp.]